MSPNSPASAHRPRPSRLDAILTWCGDRANPMLVRCLRQELRSRVFLGGFVLTLLVALVVVLIFADQALDHPDQATGRSLFATLAAVWALIVILIQGGSALRTIVNERQQATWDLVELTGLKPGTVLRGLLQANAMQSLLFTTALAPFMVMAYLLRGVDPFHIFLSLVCIGALGLASGAFGMLCGSLAGNKSLRALMGLAVLVAGGYGWGLSIFLASNPADFSAGILSQLLAGDGQTWFMLGLFLNLWLATLIGCLLSARAQLTHRAGNRSSAPRLFMLALMLNLWLLCLGFLAWAPAADFAEIATSAGLGTAILAVVLGFFACTEDRSLSPRQARDIETARGLRRLLMGLIGPGLDRGARCFLFMGLCASLLACANDGSANELFFATFGLLAYAVIIFGYGTVVSRGLEPSFILRPGQRRALLLALVLLASVFGLLVVFLSSSSPVEQEPLFLLCPLIGVVSLASSENLSQLIALWVISLPALINLLWLASTRRIRAARVLARPDDAPARGG